LKHESARKCHRQKHAKMKEVSHVERGDHAERGDHPEKGDHADNISDN